MADLTLTARVPDGTHLFTRTVTGDFHEHKVLPIAMRGKAIELELTISGAGDALLESLELVMSRKGEKLSRG